MRFRRSGPSLVIDTPAKLNLHLEVLGRRPDGFHELETVMVSVGLFDTLVITPADERIELSCQADGAFAGQPLPPSDARNLVLRSAELLRELTGHREGASLALVKRIPLEAGLGGGSSNAAAALVGLNRVWKLGLTGEELHAAAARLGSDVNFFLDSAPLAVCRGRGEQVRRSPLIGPLWFVIVKPPVGLSTAAVFGRYAGLASPARSPEGLIAGAAAGNAAECGRWMFNALERPSRELSPIVARTLDQMREEDVAGCAMTGSGAACFALCRSREHAERIGRRLRGRVPGRVYVVRTTV
ncbi:MAG: 4-(cytidine 5'-diphospho)-2-C-methyl-D-erythritol kinase [Planctomyces sp.]|nr:4-(cytidine 5'-diphospho)-2-C-methyl-D-erythritol kinase [Planctomyces sp.]